MPDLMIPVLTPLDLVYDKMEALERQRKDAQQKLDGIARDIGLYQAALTIAGHPLRRTESL